MAGRAPNANNEVILLLDILADSALDIVKTLPILVLVYALLYWIEARTRTAPALLEKAARFGPVCGAIAGAIPQCGFSAAASALYLEGCLAPATLAAVFLATSDEAIPVLLSSGCGFPEVVRLIAVKTVLAVAGGYLLRMTVLREKAERRGPAVPQTGGCPCCAGSGPAAVLRRTAQTALLLFVVLLFFNSLMFFIGEARISALLLSGSIFQPLLCATVGLLPSCAVSVLLAELYAAGAIGFGSMIAGLSTGAGFGYMILLSDRCKRKSACKIIALTWLLAAVGGIIVQSILG